MTTPNEKPSDDPVGKCVHNLLLSDECLKCEPWKKPFKEEKPDGMAGASNFHRNLASRIVCKFDALSQKLNGPRFAWTELVEELAEELAVFIPDQAPPAVGETKEDQRSTVKFYVQNHHNGWGWGNFSIGYKSFKEVEKAKRDLEQMSGSDALRVVKITTEVIS